MVRAIDRLSAEASEAISAGVKVAHIAKRAEPLTLSDYLHIMLIDL